MAEFRIPDGIDDLIDPATELEILADGFLFTEGSSWHPGTQEVHFSDVPGDARWKWSEADGVQRVERPAYLPNGTVFEPDGSLLVCEQVTSSIIRIRPDGLRQVVASHYQGKYLNSPNDAVVKSDGSVYFTDPDFGRWDCWVGVARKCDLDFRGVFRVPPGGGDLQLVADPDEFALPNGLAFSPDESVLYVDDRDDIKAFDVAADGTLHNGRVLQDGMSAQGGIGSPDGMKVDHHGNIWCTARGGVWIITPDGDLRGVIETPAACGNLVFGGPDLDMLFLMMSDKIARLRTRVHAATLPSHRLA